jgi:beta-xylosidase
MLIGMIDGSVFSVGSQGSFVAERGGTLYFRMNDDILEDNGGSLVLSVSIETPEQAVGADHSSAQDIAISQDAFDGPDLDPAWSWVREDKDHWSLTDNRGRMRIITQQGDIWEDSNNLRNLLLQRAPDGDVTVSTRLTLNPYTHAQQAGLVVYQDDHNYVRLTRGYILTGDYVQFALERSGATTEQRVPVADTTVYLAVSRTGSSYRGLYSVDGTNWLPVGQFDSVDLSEPRVGISAWNGNHPAPEIPVDFDFFRIEP